MGSLARFGVSADDELLESFDSLTAKQGYKTRSEAICDLMRDALVRSRVETEPEGKTEVLGSLSLVYDHHATDLTDRMTEIQHLHHDLVISVLHVHVNHDDCMEVIALRGQAREVRSLAESLLSLKGVKHGKLFVTLPSGMITGRSTPSKKRHSHTHTHPHTHRKGGARKVLNQSK
jgi:CopG family transcriptional regulator, nickel-responsive regulator